MFLNVSAVGTINIKSMDSVCVYMVTVILLIELKKSASTV